MRKVINILFSLILIGLILFSGFMLEKKLNEYRIALNTTTEKSLEARKGRDIDFQKLKSQNADIKGWIYLPDSHIDYPIVQAEDNDFYMHRDFDKNYLFDGSIFIDAAVIEPFSDFNTVIYGHHMFSGAMFYDLNKFAKKEYMNDHKVFIIETENDSYDLHVIAYCNEPADSKLYETVFSDDFSIEEEDFIEEDPEIEFISKAEFVDLIKTKAKVLSGEEFSEDDTFVMLSTCAYNYDDARHQVIGVLRPPALEEVETEVVKNRVNIWLIAQIAVGLIMAASVIALFPKKKKEK